MTRETKVGLVVATSFLSLVGVVVAARMSKPEEPVSKVTAPTFADAKDAKDGKPKTEKFGKQPETPSVWAQGENDKSPPKVLPASFDKQVPPTGPAPTVPTTTPDLSPKATDATPPPIAPVVPETAKTEPPPVEDPVLAQLREKKNLAMNNTSKPTATPGTNIGEPPSAVAVTPPASVDPEKRTHVKPGEPTGLPAATGGLPTAVSVAANGNNSTIAAPTPPAPTSPGPMPPVPGANPPSSIGAPPIVPPPAATGPASGPPPVVPPPAPIVNNPPMPTPVVGHPPAPTPTVGSPPLPGPSATTGGPPPLTPSGPVAGNTGTPAPTPPPPINPPATATNTSTPPTPIGGQPTNTVPPIGARPDGIAPPIAVAMGPTAAKTPLPQVKDYDVVTEQATATDQTFAELSKRFYGSDRYAPALLEYNRDYPAGDPGVRQNPPQLRPGQPIFKPPADVLQSAYPQFFSNNQANAAPAGVSVGVPTPLSTSPGNPSNVNAPPPGVIPTSTPAGSYRVRDGGEFLFGIAQQQLGNGSRWSEIYRLNPGINPQGQIPGGTMLKMP